MDRLVRLRGRGTLGPGQRVYAAPQALQAITLSASSLDMSLRSPSVSMAPGVMQFTRTLCSPISLASARVNPMIAPFEAM